MVKKRKSQREMSVADLEASALLNALWAKKRAVHPELTQEQAGEDSGVKGAFMQYLGGFIPIGIEPTLKLARYFRCRPVDIRPDFPYKDMLANPGGLSRDALSIAARWDALPQDAQDDLESSLRLQERLAYSDFYKNLATKQGHKPKSRRKAPEKA